MDDAFAGGVCRCQHCGTIQRVPLRSRAKGGEEQAAGEAAEQPQNRPASFPEPPSDKGRTAMIAAGVAGVALLLLVILWLAAG